MREDRIFTDSAFMGRSFSTLIRATLFLNNLGQSLLPFLIGVACI